MALSWWAMMPDDLIHEAFWREIKASFPPQTGAINLLHTGGGLCQTSVLSLLSDLQNRAAAQAQGRLPEFEELKESGSSGHLRQLMAKAFGCAHTEIALTRNAMEGLATGLLGVDLKAGDEVITTRSDYDACIEILRQRQRRDGIRVVLIDLPGPHEADDAVLNAFDAAITERTKLILVSHMINKTGQILPIRKVSDMARAKGIFTVVDGAQTVGQVDFSIRDLGCDVFAASLHKWFYAPKGTGVLYVQKEQIEKLWPIWASWSGKPATSIEKFEEYGTVNKAVAAVLPKVFAFHEKIGPARKQARLQYLRDCWLDPLLETGRITLLTDTAPHRSCAICAFQIHDVDADAFARSLYTWHKIQIGSIHLQDNPELRGNYLALDLVNTPADAEHFLHAAHLTLKEGRLLT